MKAPFVRGGKTLLSIDPVRRAERTADAVNIKDRTLYFCPSPIYGYGLERLISRLSADAPNSAVLCIEADAELFALAHNSIAASLARNNYLHITNICKEEALCAFVRENWGARTFRRVETVRLSGGWQLFPELYDSLCEALRREIAVDWSNAMTLAKLGRLYIRNFFRNLSLIPRFPTIEKLSFGESPVLVLGAGPSLDEILDALESRFAQGERRNFYHEQDEPTRTEEGGYERKERDERRNYNHEQERIYLTTNSGQTGTNGIEEGRENKFIVDRERRPFKIVCVDTCLGALKDRNIIPDLVVILESQHWNLRDFTGCRGWNIPAVVDLSALPASTRALGGEGFIFMTPWTHLRIFERLKDAGLLPAVVPPLGSVGLTAVEITRRVSGGKIICAGLDFSFTEDKYHARATPGHRSKLNAQTRFHGILNAAAYGAASFAAVSKTGVSVHTNHVMQNYRALFEREFAKDTRLFDIEGTGLSLGIKTLSMEEALEKISHGGTKNMEGRERNVFYHEPERIYLTTNSGQTGTNGRGEEREEREKLAEKVLTFLEGERKRLEELRDILTGVQTSKERLGVLVDECDYLWAHFPDYSGRSHPDLIENSPSALSFLKRVRTEIESMAALMERER